MALSSKPGDSPVKLYNLRKCTKETNHMGKRWSRGPLTTAWGLYQIEGPFMNFQGVNSLGIVFLSMLMLQLYFYVSLAQILFCQILS